MPCVQANSSASGLAPFVPAITVTLAAQLAASGLVAVLSASLTPRAVFVVFCVASLAVLVSFVSTRVVQSDWEAIPAAAATLFSWIAFLGVGCHLLCESLGFGHVVGNGTLVMAIEMVPAIAGGVIAARAVVGMKAGRGPQPGLGRTYRFDDDLDMIEYRLRLVAHSLMRRGLATTLLAVMRRLVYKVLNYKPRHTFEHDAIAELDEVMGIQTAKITHLSDLEIRSPNAARGVDYQPSPPAEVARALGELPIRFEEFTFVDVGCGRGLVLLLAARHAFRQVVGVDFSEELCQEAKANIVRCEDHLQICRDIKVACDDATSFELPGGPTVFYLFNPFHRPVFDEFIDHVAESLADNPRPVYLIYYGGLHHRVIKRSGVFEPLIKTFAYTIYRHIPRRSK